MKKKLFAFLFALLLILSPNITFNSNAAETLTSTLDIAGANQNCSGAGYDWKNIDEILTLDNFRLETTDDFGVKLPADSTIILKGDNYIKASECALRAVTSLNIEGSGTLTLVADKMGIMCASTSDRDVVRLRSGKITIITKTYGIYSEAASVALSGATTEINSENYAVYAKNIQMTSGKINLTGKTEALSELLISNANLTALSEAPALKAGYKMTISSVNIACGDSLDSLTPLENYNGSAAIKFTPSADNSKKSILFNGKLPRFVDYIVFISIGIIAVAIVALPIYIKMKKTKKLIAEHQEMLKKKNSRKK